MSLWEVYFFTFSLSLSLSLSLLNCQIDVKTLVLSLDPFVLKVKRDCVAL